MWGHDPSLGFPVDAVDAVKDYFIVIETNIEACIPFDWLLNDVS